MGSQTSTNIGDFQQSAGQVTGQLGVISAYFVAFIFIIIAIIIAYEAFQQISIRDMGSQQVCTTTPDCKVTGELCQDGKCSPPPPPKSRHLWFLIISVILIALSIFTVYYAITLRNIAQSSRGGAQVVGLMGEAELVKNL